MRYFAVAHDSTIKHISDTVRGSDLSNQTKPNKHSTADTMHKLYLLRPLLNSCCALLCLLPRRSFAVSRPQQPAFVHSMPNVLHHHDGDERLVRTSTRSRRVSTTQRQRVDSSAGVSMMAGKPSQPIPRNVKDTVSSLRAAVQVCRTDKGRQTKEYHETANCGCAVGET